MKPKWYEWIPFYGAYKYFNRYFDTNKRTMKEAIIAEWMFMYHSTLGPCLMLVPIIKLFI
jgi:hypothetical protein